ncbi:hypothetical protein [Halosimplex sp. TS25]|uniref:hypothetical protein n=1 Tax=Halosimplex rarum TaxID=3396619 RepID=UPI0039EBE6CF
MTNGMKDGAGEDPFAEDPEPVEQTTEPDETDDEPATEFDNSGKSESIQETEELPYVLTRKTVKEDRNNEHVALLWDEYSELEDDIHERVADEMGISSKDLSVFDLREAVWELADEHSDELADILLGSGYEHRK